LKRFVYALVALLALAAQLPAAPGDIAVFFGSFDPFHNGHLAVVRGALPDLGVDRVLVIPTPASRKRRHKASLSDRLAMVRAAAYRHRDLAPPDATIAQILRSGDGDWKAQILGYLYKQLRPGGLVQEIMGMDRFHDVLRDGMVPPKQEPRMLVVVDRPGHPLDLDLMRKTDVAPGKILFLHPEVVDVDSTRLRKDIHEGNDVFGRMPVVVRKLIEARKLYR
jgi:nicotinate (nicotinamide) nucleotide adenylyltransferase